MKDAQSHPRWAGTLSCLLLTLAVVGLLPWRLVAQSRRPRTDLQTPIAAAARNNAFRTDGSGDSAVGKPLATVSVGQFKIAIDNVRRVNAAIVDYVPSGFGVRDNMLLGNVREERTSFTETYSSGGGSGGAGGAAGGFVSSGAVKRFGPAHVVLDLLVSRAGRGRNQLLCTAVGKVQAKDNLGNVIDAPDLPAHLKAEARDVPYPQGSGRAAVHLKMENMDARSIKSLTGDLLVSEARIQNTAFRGAELHKVSVHRLAGVSVRLDECRLGEEGIDAKVGVTMPDPFNDARNFHNMRDRLKVLLEDSEGEKHKAQSGSGGGGGSGGGSFASSGGGGMSRRRGGQARELPMASYNLHFAPLPEGRTVKSFQCTVTELLGKPQVISFEFDDLPLP